VARTAAALPERARFAPCLPRRTRRVDNERQIVVGDPEDLRMRQQGAYETDWAAAHPRPRRTDASDGAGGVNGVLLGLQRAVGNAAVAGQLGGPQHRPASAAPMAFVQRCGPTPCNCSADERADYAEKHPDEPASPDVESAGAGHGHG
jgi:hypothetical protein